MQSDDEDDECIDIPSECADPDNIFGDRAANMQTRISVPTLKSQLSQMKRTQTEISAADPVETQLSTQHFGQVYTEFSIKIAKRCCNESCIPHCK